MGEFAFSAMEEPEAREIAGWRYEPPYDVYHCEPGQVEESVRTFVEPRYRYYSLRDADGELAGYLCFGDDGRVPGGDYGAPALDVGGGLRPDLTGQGLGRGLLEAAHEFARRHFAPVSFRVTVAAFNRRALRVCERAGYRRVQVFEATGTGQPLVVLMREAEQAAAP